MATRKKEDVAAAIKAGNKALGAAIAAGDSKAAAALYTKGAKLLPANAPVQKGHAAIARFWKGAIEMGIRGVQLRTVDLDVHGSTGICSRRTTPLEPSLMVPATHRCGPWPVARAPGVAHSLRCDTPAGRLQRRTVT